MECKIRELKSKEVGKVRGIEWGNLTCSKLVLCICCSGNSLLCNVYIAQGETSALRSHAGSSTSNSSSSEFFSRQAFVLLAVVSAVNTVAILALLACWVRRRMRTHVPHDVISVESDMTSEPVVALTWSREARLVNAFWYVGRHCWSWLRSDRSTIWASQSAMDLECTDWQCRFSIVRWVVRHHRKTFPIRNDPPVVSI